MAKETNEGMKTYRMKVSQKYKLAMKTQTHRNPQRLRRILSNKHLHCSYSSSLHIHMLRTCTESTARGMCAVSVTTAWPEPCLPKRDQLTMGGEWRKSTTQQASRIPPNSRLTFCLFAILTSSAG